SNGAACYRTAPAKLGACALVGLGPGTPRCCPTQPPRSPWAVLLRDNRGEADCPRLPLADPAQESGPGRAPCRAVETLRLPRAVQTCAQEPDEPTTRNLAEHRRASICGQQSNRDHWSHLR